MKENLRVEPADPLLWDSLVRTFPQHTVFHLLPWLEGLAATAHLDFVLLLVKQGDRTVAVWPCLTGRKGPVRIVGSPLPGVGTPYMGPLIRADVDAPDVLRTFLGHPVFRRSSYVACRVMDRDQAIDLGPFGFTPTRRFETFRIDLQQTEDELWRNLKSECRTRIRRARKLRVDVRREDTPGFIDELWAMTLQTYQRSGSRPIHTKQVLEQVWERLHPAGRLLTFSAFLDGERLSTLMLPFDDRTLYYWVGATFDRHRRIPASNLLQWHAILEAKRRGLEGYDMYSTTGGPGRFKRTFGAEVVQVATYWERHSSRLVAALKSAYALYQRTIHGIPRESAPQADS